jgi:hypothetical protein
MRFNFLLSAVAALTGWFTAVPTAVAQDWVMTTAPTNIWSSIACSADGTKLVAATGSPQIQAGFIFTSSDGGATWMPAEPFAVWQSVASSADGTKLVAVSFTDGDLLTPGHVYTSTNAGASWALTSAAQANWQSVACSADGVKLAAAGYFSPQGDFIYTSTNSGASWTQTTAPDTNWTSVASSADGTKLVAASGGNIYASVDSGATWTPTSAPSLPSGRQWSSVGSSADGSKLAAGWRRAKGATGGIYVSRDSGATWTQTSAPNYYWSSVASSADGNKLAVASGPIGSSRIYVSQDSGTSWAATAPNIGGPLVSSADGNKLVAAGWFVAAFNGYGYYAICTLKTDPIPLLDLTRSSGAALLSWTIPSMDFTLQQNSDVTTTNWTDVPTSPVLNLTNLQNQVIVSPTNGNAFYRLKH